jgi:dTDP-4-amino-4,6-dideoxygalactose transaminase
MRTKRPTFLPFSPPVLGEEEIAEVVDTLRSGWITTGPKTHKFEQEFCEFIGAPAALALNSCTGALHVALAVLGLGPGDEVITTPMTFCSTVNVIEQVGARPVLADVEPDTLNLSPAQVEAKITANTRALLPVHYGGHPCDMDPLLDLATQHNLHVIEDAAHALTATYQGKRIGALGTLTAFSFYATKNLTTAEGGMLTGDPEILDRARIWSLHGMSHNAWKRYDKGGSWYYEVVLPGFKYNMTDMQASLGLWQMRRLDEFQKRRREVVAAYSAAFAGEKALQVPVERAEVTHAWHLYTLRLRPDVLRIDRNRFIEELAERNIGTSVHFIPIHIHPYYRDRYGFRPDDFPVALENYERILSLPLNPGLSDEDVTDVIQAVLDVVKAFRR